MKSPGLGLCSSYIRLSAIICKWHYFLSIVNPPVREFFVRGWKRATSGWYYPSIDNGSTWSGGAWQDVQNKPGAFNLLRLAQEGGANALGDSPRNYSKRYSDSRLDLILEAWPDLGIWELQCGSLKIVIYILESQAGECYYSTSQRDIFIAMFPLMTLTLLERDAS